MQAHPDHRLPARATHTLAPHLASGISLKGSTRRDIFQFSYRGYRQDAHFHHAHIRCVTPGLLTPLLSVPPSNRNVSHQSLGVPKSLYQSILSLELYVRQKHASRACEVNVFASLDKSGGRAINNNSTLPTLRYTAVSGSTNIPSTRISLWRQFTFKHVAELTRPDSDFVHELVAMGKKP